MLLPIRTFGALVALITLLVAGAGLLAPAAHAAIPESGWEWTPPTYTPGVSGITAVTSLQKGPSGSIYAVGNLDQASPDTLTDSKVCVARLDAETGAKVWARATRGPGGSGALTNAATVDRKRSLIVAGRVASGAGNGYVAKYSPAGKLLWSRRFAGSRRGPDAAAAVVADSHGNVFVAGSVTDKSTGRDAVLLKYGAGGVLRWRFVLATAKADAFTSLALDAAGDPYAVGTRFADDAYSQIVTVRVRANGRLVWRKYVDLAGTLSAGVKVIVRSSGVAAGVYVAGTRTSGDIANPVVPRIGKYSLAGEPLWGAPLPVAMTVLSDMAVDGQGRPVFVGGQYDVTDAHACGLVGFVSADGTLASSYRFSNDQTGVAGGLAAGLDRVVVDAEGRSYASGWIATDAGSTATNAIVASYPSIDAGAEAFDRLWRYEGPASGDHDRFTPLLAVTAAEIFAGGSRDGPGAVVQGVLERLDLSGSQ